MDFSLSIRYTTPGSVFHWAKRGHLEGCGLHGANGIGIFALPQQEK
jgi:hypothetical protein